MCQVPCLPTEGSLQNGDKCRKAICKKCIMPIKTSPGQLTPFRRGVPGDSLIFSRKACLSADLPIRPGGQGAKPKLGQLPPAILRDRLLTRGLGGFLDFLAQRRQAAKKSNRSLPLVSCLSLLCRWYPLLGTLYLVLRTLTCY